MKASTQHEITDPLRAWSDGQQDAHERLMPLVYEELHRLARSYMVRERPDHTLQTTALVNEAYLRLIDASSLGVQQLAQQCLDLGSLGGFAIQLRHQVEHHLLQDPGIFRKMFGIDCHE
jgi:hypothetical protein